jgi:hypothetical protein
MSTNVRSMTTTLDAVERPSSVWAGSDQALLVWAIPFYLRDGRKPVVLDATYGRGTFWKDWPAHAGVGIRNFVGADVAPQHEGIYAVDNRAMPWDPESFDVVVYDPPHITDSSPRGQYAERYATTGHGENISAQFPAFLREAHRVLQDGGIVLAKIADMVHQGRAQWQHVDFIIAAQQAGFTVCDLIIKTRNAVMNDPKWKRVLHARKSHCFWIVCRKGGC